MFIHTLTTKRVAVVILTIALVFLVFGALFTVSVARANALTDAQVQSILSLLSSFGADQATIDNVDASLRGLPTSGTGSTSGGNGFTFTLSHSQGDSGGDVMEIQKFLNTDPDTRVAVSGVGSAGNETSFFGSLTKAAVIKFQEKYTAEVLTPVGLSAGTGFWGPSSRAQANTLNAGGGSTSGGDTGGTTTPAPTGTGLTVTSVTQPLNSLAPDNAARVAFTKFRLTAGNDGDVEFNNITVKRVGLGSNNSISGLILLDENGIQIGNEKTLNSNEQATIGEKTTVKSGQSMVFTVAANMPADNSARDGEQLAFNVIAINTSATVTGSLPISGATHTVNAALAIGKVTMEKGTSDPDAASTQEVGTKAFIFSAVKATTGSQENVLLRSVRWDQSGSVSGSDLDNVIVNVDGVDYPTTLASDGDHYSAILPGGGLLVEEGLSVEISVKADIKNGANRTVNFDIERSTDLDFVGETFGFGITPTIGGNNDSDSSSDDSEFNDGTSDGGVPPFYDGRKITVGAGTLNISVSSQVPAGNIANGANDVPLGAFLFDVEGEKVTWSTIKFTIATTSGGGTSGDKTITNVTIVDSNGNVIAGPSDPNEAGSLVTLSDSVTLPVGDNILIVRGNLDNDWAADDTIKVTHTPGSQVTDLEGEDSGNTVTPTPSSVVNGKIQTVSAGTLDVSPSSSLTTKNIIANATGVVFGRYTLDATASGEDVRVRTVKIRGTTGTSADLDDINTLQLFVNGVALNTGSNINNPSGNAIAADATLTFTLDDSGVTVPKGTTAIMELRGNIGTSTGDSVTTYIFDFSSLSNGDWGVSGVDTGKDITETLSATAGATLTITAAGTLTASVDSSDPVERWYLPGETATIAVFDFLSTNEQLEVTDLSLSINNASTSAADYTELSLWEVGATTAFITKSTPAFGSASNSENFDFDSAGLDFIVPSDDDKDLIVKAKFAAVGKNLPGTSGNLLRVSTTTLNTDNQARGVQSGTSVKILGNAGTSTGARYFRALPQVQTETFSVPTLANGTQELYRFSVTALGDDVALYKFTFNVATTGVTTTAFKLTELETGKIVNSALEADSSGDIDFVVSSGKYGTAVITVPTGVKRTYKLQGTVANAGTASQTESVQTKLLQDSEFTSLASGVAAKATNVDTSGQDNFIWSPQSTTTAALNNLDWFNGFRIRGLEFDDLDITTLSN